MSQAGLNNIAGSLPSNVPTTFTGNTGGAISPVANNMNFLTANSTVQFVGTAATETLDFSLSNLVLGSSLPSLTSGTGNVGLGSTVMGTLTSGNNNVGIGSLALQSILGGNSNVAIGLGSGRFITTGSSNTFVGTSSGAATTTGSSNSAFGQGSLSIFTTGATSTGSNTAIGQGTLAALATGVQNTALGAGAGAAHTTSDSSNIDIKNAGVAGESNVIRIGTQGSGTGQQNVAYMAGITGVTTSNSNMVTLNTSTGQLGAAAMPGYALALTQVTAFPSPADSTTYYMTTAATWSTTIAGATTGRLWIPKTGTITAAYGSIAVTGTLGSAENTSVEIRLNNTTNTNITSTLQLTAALNTFNNAALGIAVTAGDYIHFQVITPAWVTNPTSVVFNCSIIIT